MGSKITVHHGCVATGYQFDHWHDFGGERNLGKTELPGKFSHTTFMFRTGIGMEKNHTNGCDAAGKERFKFRAQQFQIRFGKYRKTFTGHPL